MSAFEGYSRERLALTLCLEENSILLSRAILDALNSPRQVQMLINEERGMLLLQGCTVDDREAVIIPQTPFTQFEMSGHSLLKRIRRLTGWTDNRPRVIFGDFVARHHVVVFNLAYAQPAAPQSPFCGGSGGLN